jgi:hypothetical protein
MANLTKYLITGFAAAYLAVAPSLADASAYFKYKFESPISLQTIRFADIPFYRGTQPTIVHAVPGISKPPIRANEMLEERAKPKDPMLDRNNPLRGLLEHSDKK